MAEARQDRGSSLLTEAGWGTLNTCAEELHSLKGSTPKVTPGEQGCCFLGHRAPVIHLSAGPGRELSKYPYSCVCCKGFIDLSCLVSKALQRGRAR